MTDIAPAIWNDESEKDKMRATAEQYMPDVGRRLIWSVAVDEFGDSIETWTNGLETSCGIEFKEGYERTDDMTTVTYEATIRVPHDFIIEPEDRFRITSFRGDLVSWEYEIATAIRYGISAKRFGVRKLEH